MEAFHIFLYLCDVRTEIDSSIESNEPMKTKTNHESKNASLNCLLFTYIPPSLVGQQ